MLTIKEVVEKYYDLKRDKIIMKRQIKSFEKLHKFNSNIHTKNELIKLRDKYIDLDIRFKKFANKEIMIVTNEDY